MYRKWYICTISETVLRLRDFLLEVIAIRVISKSNGPKNPNNAHPSYAVFRSSSLTRLLISLFAIQWNPGEEPENQCLLSPRIGVKGDRGVGDEPTCGIGDVLQLQSELGTGFAKIFVFPCPLPLLVSGCEIYRSGDG